MALDGLSNQSVGIYRTKDPSKTTEKLTAQSKAKAEIQLKEIEDEVLIEKINPDDKNNKEQNNKKEQIIYQTNKLIKEDDENQVLELVLEDETSSTELEYTLKFNSETKLIEMKNIKQNETIETIKPEELLRVIAKAKIISGVLCDKKI